VKLALTTLAAALATISVVLPAGASAPRLPSQVWGVSVVHASSKDVAWKRLATLGESGVNAVVVNGHVFKGDALNRLRAAAGGNRLLVIPLGTCDRCLRVVSSPAAAVKAARKNSTVAVRLRSPLQIRYLRGLRAGRVIAVLQLRGGGAFALPSWKRAVQVAAGDARLDLAVAPAGRGAAAGLAAYLPLVAAYGRSKPAETPPAGGQPPPARNGTANLWVDTNGGACTRLAAPAPYADSAACGTFDSAYQAASPGDTIVIRGGSYGSQRIRDRSNLSLGSKAIVFHPAAGQDVTVTGSVQIYAHDLVFDGGDTVGVNEPNRITITGESDSEESLGMRDSQTSAQRGQHRNLVVEDVHIRNVKTSSDYSVLRFSEVGPSDLKGNLCSDLVQTADEPTQGWVVEYNLVHDNKSAGCGDAHIDAFDVYMVDGVIRGNRIWWCGTQCIFTGDPSSILVENNMIEETRACGSGCAGPQELALMGTFTVRYNTIEGDDGYGKDDPRDTRRGSGEVYGNVFLGPAKYTCRDQGSSVIRVNRHNNVYPPGSSSCGSAPKFCTPRLANGSLYTDGDRQADFHIAASDTCARGAGPPGYPAVDLDQQARPQAGTPDAGADER
jgi:hypothetical protein